MTSVPDLSLATPPRSARNAFALLEALEAEHRLGLRLDLVPGLRGRPDSPAVKKVRESAESTLDLLVQLAESDSDLRHAIPSRVLRRLQPRDEAGRVPPGCLSGSGVLESCGELLGREPSETRCRAEDVVELRIALAKTTRNNVVICSEAGNGKTTLVETFAWRTREERPVFRVDLARMVAGTKFRGDLEARFVELFEAAAAADMVLFFDEIHVLRTIGSADGGIDVVSLLKPHLTRSDFTVIGATTPVEAVSFFSDLAIRRRFSILRLRPLTKQEVKDVIRDATTRSPWLGDLENECDLMVDALTTIVPHRSLIDATTDFLEYAESCRRLSMENVKESIAVPTTVTGMLQRFAAVQYVAGETGAPEKRKEV
jgi:hypothetical protein